jgi:hypothetical protein
MAPPMSRNPGTLNYTPFAQTNATDDGTMCRMESPVPNSIGSGLRIVDEPPIYVSEEVRAEYRTAEGIVAQLSYDAFVRKYFYEPAAKLISEQGEALVRNKILTSKEAAEWVRVQRNQLIIKVRDQMNSPLGRAYSEYLKPRNKFKTLPELFKDKAARMPGATEEQVYNAVIKGGRNTRGWVNKVGFALRWAGPVMIGIDVYCSARLVMETPPEQRFREASKQAGGIMGGLGGAWAGGRTGAWVGCRGGAAVGVWFEGVGAIPGCLVGTVVLGTGGAIAGGYYGAKGGESAATWIFDESTVVIEWLETKTMKLEGTISPGQ